MSAGNWKTAWCGKPTHLVSEVEKANFAMFTKYRTVQQHLSESLRGAAVGCSLVASPSFQGPWDPALIIPLSALSSPHFLCNPSSTLDSALLPLFNNRPASGPWHCSSLCLDSGSPGILSAHSSLPSGLAGT